MSVASVLSIYYKDKEWACGDTMILLRRKPKTQEKMNGLYELFSINKMRENEINFYLKVIIKMAIDFPHKEGERELWTQYRIELRNLPEIWVNGISSFPEKPQ